MNKLETTYMGIKLNNPLIMGACNISAQPDLLKKAEQEGVGAIVYKTLFEEQVQLENLQLDEQLSMHDNLNAEMTSIFPDVDFDDIDYHLTKLRKTKEALSVPVIASLNAVNESSWLRYAQMIEQTGVDGLEINLYRTPTDFETDSLEIERRQLEIVREIKRVTTFPVGVKLSSDYTNPLNFIKKLDETGVDAVVLFNSFFQPDINIKDEKHTRAYTFSQKGDYRQSLRFSGMLHGKINADICSSRGIYEGSDVIKLILSGATTVQVVSTLYKNGITQISKILKEIENWMTTKGYSGLSDFRGKLADINLDKNQNALAYKRAQYIDALLNSDTIFGKL